jgi:hypothetical protein
LYFILLSSCASHEKFTPKRQCRVDLQKLIITYNIHVSYALEASKVSMLILWENFKSSMILAVVTTNANKKGRTDVLGRRSYFLNKCS